MEGQVGCGRWGGGVGGGGGGGGLGWGGGRCNREVNFL